METVAEDVVRAVVGVALLDAAAAVRDRHSGGPPAGTGLSGLRFVHYSGEGQVPLRATGKFLEKQIRRPSRAVPLTV